MSDDSKLRPCPKCETPMEQKQWGSREYRFYCEHGGWLSIWQCPSCKNVEVMAPDHAYKAPQ